ncbi:MAG: S-adenosylmethionine decarboxylase, partial [Betaproteobacteria bacterium]|nr:S-adenosylmethionine decarboxylase [Betaproteobacteria bacterium]
ESHLAIHTWPELDAVTIDVYVCNFTTDNTAKAERVFATLKSRFAPARSSFQAIQRGGVPAEALAPAGSPA